jgi:hypothetical protein
MPYYVIPNTGEGSDAPSMVMIAFLGWIFLAMIVGSFFDWQKR